MAELQGSAADGEPGLVVRGGLAGTAAGLEAIRATAAELARLGGMLAAAGMTLLSTGADPRLLAGVLVSPVTWGRAEARLVFAATGPHGALPAAARLEDLAAAAATVAAMYAATEAAVGRVVSTADLLAGQAVGRVVPLLAVTPAGWGAVTGLAVTAATPAGRGAVLTLLADHPALAENVAGALPGLVGGLVGSAPLGGSAGQVWGAVAGTPWPPRDLTGVAALLAAVGRSGPWLSGRGQVRVQEVALHPADPPAGVADLVSGVADCYPAGATGQSRVRVESVTGPDGGRAWVVEIPGTVSWSPRPGADPFDLTSDVRDLGGGQSAARQAVLASMDAAGVPAGEPVLLAGHSLGGMVAAGLAADPAFRARYRVTHVVTVGSPVARYPVPAQVQVLALEHTDDLVPRLDGVPDPDRPGWVTVSRRAAPAGAVADPGESHAVQGYVETAALVDASDDPSVRAWRQGAAAFLDRPGARAQAVDAEPVRVVAP